ncbi:unnamed protein product [Sphagnum tenellum]
MFKSLVIGSFFILAVYGQGGQTSSPPSAVFIFGDSLVDVGNNNYITTLARANLPPNGIDFPQGPTGRFCNGRTVADLLVESFGLSYPLPYLDPNNKGSMILKGVNFASAAAGILDSTGYDYIGRIPMNQQLQWAANTKSQIVQLVGEAQTEAIFANALFSVTMGSNDYINNYLIKGSSTSSSYNPQQYQDLLISTFSQQLTTLYNLGARKVVVTAVGPLGCIPSQLVLQLSVNGECVPFINGYVQGFNAALKSLLQQLTSTLPGATFVYANAYDMVQSFINNPANYGFTTVNEGCCGRGPYNGLVPCIPGASVCPNRRLYFFWDPFHPTEAANIMLSNAFLSGGTDVIEPVNIQQLVAM